MHLERVLKLVDVLCFALLESTQNSNLLQRILHAAIAVWTFGIKVHFISLQDLDSNDAASLRLVAIS